MGGSGRFGRGQEYAKLGRFAAAIVNLEQCLVHDPQCSAAWKLLGKTLAEAKGDVPAAKAVKVFLQRLQKTG